MDASDPSSESSESSVFSDGYDSDYIGDEEDRRRLDNMTEKEREEEIYRRTEQRDILLKRFQLQKKLKQQEKDARRAERQKRRAEKQKLKKAKKKSAKFVDQEEHEEGQEGNNNENNQSPKLNDKTNNLSDFLDNESSPLKNATGSSSMDRRKANESKKKDTGVSKALANLKADREKKKQIAEDNRQRLEKLQQQQKKLRTEDVFSSSSSDDDESVGKKRIRSKSSGSSGSQASSASGSESGSESDSGSGSSSDSESAAASKLPITTKEELNKAKLSRFKIEKWCHAPFFKQVACGCFVRIGIGLNQGISIYRVAQIVDVVETAKVYQLGTTKTNKGFKLKHGGEERTYRLEFVSNQPFTDDEFKRWKDALNKADMNPPSIREIENKHKELQSYVNYRFKDEDIDVIVKEKKRFIKDTDKIAEKKIECEAMVETKMCNNKKMKCDYDSCSFTGHFKISKAQWNNNVRQENFDCKLKKIAILTDNINKPLFNTHSGDCIANSLQCKLYDSIIIWNKTIINSCDMSIMHIGYNYTFRNNLLYSQDEKLLFEMTEPEINCGIKT